MKRTPIRRRRPQPIATGIICGKPWPASWMSEADWQQTVEANAALYGWEYFHMRLPRMSREGLPDLVLWKDRELWRELKVRDREGKAPSLRPDQWRIINRINSAGGNAKPWYWPDDYEEMIEELKR